MVGLGRVCWRIPGRDAAVVFWIKLTVATVDPPEGHNGSTRPERHSHPRASCERAHTGIANKETCSAKDFGHRVYTPHSFPPPHNSFLDVVYSDPGSWTSDIPD